LDDEAGPSDGRLSLLQIILVAAVGDYRCISSHADTIWRGTGFPTRESGNEFPHDLHGLESPCHFGCGCRAMLISIQIVHVCDDSDYHIEA
jgi:hypothetical protein